MNNVTLINQCKKDDIPSESEIQKWILHALEPTYSLSQINVCCVEADEIQRMNQQFRKIDKHTNVLAFPNEAPPELSDDFLGDIVICPFVVEQESLSQKKQLFDHWAHLIIHATLHLQGYDHHTEREAKIMESKEIDLLAQLGIDNPYEVPHE